MIKFFHQQTKPILVTAPRYFGKTTNLYMLRNFYEIQVDESGVEVDKNHTENRALFAGLVKRKRASKKTIFRDEKWCDEQMATHPVLHYSFENLTISGVMDFLKSFQQLTARVCKEHSYLLKSDRFVTSVFSVSLNLSNFQGKDPNSSRNGGRKIHFICHKSNAKKIVLKFIAQF